MSDIESTVDRDILMEQAIKILQATDMSKIISKISEENCPPSTNCMAIGCELCWARWLSEEVKKSEENK